MQKDKLQNLLRQADGAFSAGEIDDAETFSLSIRRLCRRRRLVKTIGRSCAAVVILACAALWFTAGNLWPSHSRSKIAEKNTESPDVVLARLNRQLDVTLELIEQASLNTRKEKAAEQQGIESYDALDALDEMQLRLDKTAFTLVYQADVLYKQLDLKQSAVDAYNQVIELFPNNRWADVARQRLEQIKEDETKKQGERA